MNRIGLSIGIALLALAGLGPAADELEDRLEAVRALKSDGHLEEAESRARELLADVETTDGPDSIRAAEGIDLLVEILLDRNKQRDAETRRMAERAVAIRQSHHPKDDLLLANSLRGLATVLSDSSDQAQAAQLFDRAIAIHEAAGPAGIVELSESLARQGYLFIRVGDPAAAELVLERSLQIRESELGPDAPEVAHSLTLLSYAIRGDWDRVIAMRERVLAIRELTGRADHPQIGWALHQLAEARLRIGRRPTRPLLERALPIMEAVYGEESETVIAILNNLALAIEGDGDLEYAREIYERVLVALERRNGPEHRSTIGPLMNLGGALWKVGFLIEAEDAYRRALANAERAGAKRDRQLHNLAFVLGLQGRFDEAVELHDQALTLMIERRGPEHPDVATSLSAKGSVLLDQGDYVGAWEAFERAGAMMRKLNGKEDPGIRFHLGEVAWTLGDRAAARREFEIAITIFEKELHESSTDWRLIRGSYARLLMEMGETDAAREQVEMTLAVTRRLFGEDSPKLAGALRMMANLEGDLDEARRLHEAAIASLAKRWGPRHPDVARGQLELAISLRREGQPEAARPLLEEALQTARVVYGSLNPAVAQTEVELGTVRWMLGEESEALAMAIDAELESHRHLQATLRTLPERQALVYAAQRPQGIDLALSIVAASKSEPNLEPLWDVLIRSRAVVLDEMAARNRAVLGGADAEVEKLAEELAATRAWTARVVVEGPDSDDPESYSPKLERALMRREDAERKLAQKSAAFRRELAMERAGWSEVAAELPAGSALVAFVRYDRSTQVPEEDRTRLDVTPAYAAFVYAPDGDPGVRLVQLGNSERIDALVESWRRRVAARPPAAKAAGRRAEGEYKEAGAALREAVWDPVLAVLDAPDRIYVVPDGPLHLVSFATLPDASGGYLVEGGPLLHVLSAERDLIRSDADANGHGLLALGSPDFDTEPGLPPAAEMAAATEVFPTGGADLYRGPRAACEDFRSQEFAPLPASLDEIEEIAELWNSASLGNAAAAEPALILSGASAHEGTLKRLASGRRVIHLATHGFFLGSGCGQVTLGDASARGTSGKLVAVGNNPLIFSGLALAGANQRENATGEDEDGVLTAEEIASLDLRGVEWVVLSACQTAVGEVRPREGVLGLRRAFRVAGAATLIMSLWSVDDAATREWMRRVYAARAEGLSTAESCQRASIESITRRRKEGRSTHPFYWGAFVAAGDWR